MFDEGTTLDRLIKVDQTVATCEIGYCVARFRSISKLAKDRKLMTIRHPDKVTIAQLIAEAQHILVQGNLDFKIQEMRISYCFRVKYPTVDFAAEEDHILTHPLMHTKLYPFVEQQVVIVHGTHVIN